VHVVLVGGFFFVRCVENVNHVLIRCYWAYKRVSHIDHDLSC
jgi:hypothetical protein